MEPLAAQEENHQKIVPINSEAYEAIRSLYIVQGLALPSSAGPWSEDELLAMLDRIKPESLSDAALNIYDYATRALQTKASYFKPTATLNLEGYAHADPEHFVTQDFYVRDWDDTKPLLSFEFESWVSRNFYGFGQFSIGSSVYNAAVDSPYTDFDISKRPSDEVIDPEFQGIVGSRSFGKTAVSSNLALLYNGSLDMSMPYRAFIAGGGKGFTISLGRDRLSWGPGESGNFLIGNQVGYHTGVRASFYNPVFKYTYLISEFAHPAEYYKRNNLPPYDDNPYNDNETGYQPLQGYQTGDGDRGKYRGFKYLVAHRLEGRLFSGKLGLALSESVIHQDREGDISIEFFLPLTLLHDINRAEESNSLLTVEADFALLPSLNIYAQVAVDEFAIPGMESSPGIAADPTAPSAFGYMLGAKSAFPLWKGIFSASLEGAYTDPYLYLRADYSKSQRVNEQNQDDYPMNFVAANRYRYGNLAYWEEFLGYKYGGDAIVINANAAYREFGKWKVGTNIMFMAHGATDKWTLYRGVTPADTGYDGDNNAIQYTPSSHGTPNNADLNAATRNAISYTTAISFSGSVQMGSLPPFVALWAMQGLSVFGQLDLITVVNPGNRKENAAITDVQITLGASYRLEAKAKP